MSRRYEDLVRGLRDAVLGSSGVTQAALRRAVESGAAQLGGRSGSGASVPPVPPVPLVPPALAGFVDKVAQRAFTVTHEDVAALRRAGYSEDAIFEITASAALGAGLGRLERGLAALKGEL